MAPRRPLVPSESLRGHYAVVLGAPAVSPIPWAGISAWCPVAGPRGCGLPAAMEGRCGQITGPRPGLGESILAQG